jgi:uncharacterized protein YcsI (UPF0317 family)
MDLVSYRAAVRAGAWTGPTRGAAPGHVQCNLVVVPEAQAGPFADWCAANPSVAPVMARSEPGDPRLPELGADLDLRTDLPRYRAFRAGELVGVHTDVTHLWRDDLVAFAFGCSFSLEEVLRRHDVPLPAESRGFGGAIYQTTVPTIAVQAYGGDLVVSMRPVPRAAVDRAIAVSAAYPWLHGAPVHVGDPAGLGVSLDRPLDSFGVVSVLEDEVPVFWACGVTTQRAVERARPPWAITHESAHMLVTDVPLDATVRRAGS